MSCVVVPSKSQQLSLLDVGSKWGKDIASRRSCDLLTTQSENRVVAHGGSARTHTYLDQGYSGGLRQE